MSEPRTLPERLDAAQTPGEFMDAIQGLFKAIEQQMDDE